METRDRKGEMQGKQVRYIENETSWEERERKEIAEEDCIIYLATTSKEL